MEILVPFPECCLIYFQVLRCSPDCARTCFVDWAGLPASNLWQLSCLCLPTAGITSMHLDAQVLGLVFDFFSPLAMSPYALHCPGWFQPYNPATSQPLLGLARVRYFKMWWVLPVPESLISTVVIMWEGLLALATPLNGCVLITDHAYNSNDWWCSVALMECLRCWPLLSTDPVLFSTADSSAFVLKLPVFAHCL